MSIHIGPEKTLPAVVPHTLTAVAWNHNLPIPALTPNNLSKSSKSNKKHEDIWRHTWRDTWRHDTRPTPGQKHQRSKGTHQETHDQTQRGRMHMLNPTKRAHAQTHRDIIKFHTLILCSLYEFHTFILYSLHKFHTLILRVCVCVPSNGKSFRFIDQSANFQFNCLSNELLPLKLATPLSSFAQKRQSCKGRGWLVWGFTIIHH